jgi:hypothetical protein
MGEIMRSLLTIIKQKDTIRFPIFVCLMILFFVGISFLTAAPVAAQVCTVDQHGADDEPGQKDINEFCEGPGTSPFELDVTFNFDDTRWAGNNTGDACALFDTDDDTFANFALCVTVADGNGQPAFQSPLSPRLYQCADDRKDRCTSSVEILIFSSTCSVNMGGSEASGEDADPFALYANRKCSGTDCDTQDAFIACSIEIDDVSPGEFCNSGTCFISNASCSSDDDCVPISDVCSFASTQPNSDPSDCIVTPPPQDLCLGVDCTHLDDDCNIGACDPGTGDCVPDPKPFSTPCEDGNLCTSLTGTPQTLDHCEFGVCTGVPVDCSGAGDQCNVGICDPGTGNCEQDPLPKNGDPCDDDLFCTLTDTCQNGQCIGNGDPCPPSDICDEDSDQCLTTTSTTTTIPITTTSVPTTTTTEPTTTTTEPTTTTTEPTTTTTAVPITTTVPVTTTIPTTTTTIPQEEIPTLGEWGMIIFLTIIMGLGVVMLYRRREI